MLNRDPINTKTRVIPYAEIKDFRLSNIPYNPQPLLEDVARAFDEPIITEDGIASRWVVKVVTQAQWSKHYSHVPAYRFLKEDGSMVVMGFRKPVHEIDRADTPYATEIEVVKLEKYS